MIRLSMMFAVTALALGFSTPVFACLESNYSIKLIALNADGTVTRSVYVKKDADGQNSQEGTSVIRVIRDSIQVVRGDVLTLNAAPTMVDATHFVQIAMKEQDRDDKGVFSTTYHVVETTQSTFGGNQNKAQKAAYLVTVKSSYLGNGTYGRACGTVTKTLLDLESSGDVRPSR